jgi:hypothetical protein
MANFLLSYDLNGSNPTHQELDEHLEESGWEIARILETVWYIGAGATQKQVYDYAQSVLSKNDRIIVATVRNVTFRKLLIDGEDFKAAWRRNK